MLKFAWRWAKVGDQVLVHNRDDLSQAFIPATVTFVKRAHGETRIGVRVVENGEGRFIWPTPLFVHPNPLDPDETCWICDEYDTPNKTQTRTKESVS